MTKVKASWKKFCSLKKKLVFFVLFVLFLSFLQMFVHILHGFYFTLIHWLSALRVELKVYTECGQKAAVLGHVISANISVM